jgi:hypothetical protein
MSRANSPLTGKLIFAVGARRSGTNWLQRVLTAHPSVVGVPSETYLFSQGVRPLMERFHHGGASSTRTGFVYADREAILDAARDLCDVVFDGLIRALRPGAERIVERTPEHVCHLDLIGQIYPDAHVVHIIRDGRDVVRSLLSHEWGPSDARNAAIEWRTAIESARAAAPTLAHYHEVSYERMLAEPRERIVELFHAIGLSAEEHELEPVLAEAGVGYNADPSSPRIEAGKWRTDLSAPILAAVDEVAGDLLERLGYEPSSAAGGPRTATVVAPKRRVRRFGRRPEAGPSPDVVQRMLDRFLQAAAIDAGTVADLLAPDVRIRIVDGDTRFDARGDEARARLIDELRADDALRGRQSFGYIHPSTPSVMFVGTFERGGTRHPRVFVLAVNDDLVERVSYYRFPAV